MKAPAHDDGLQIKIVSPAREYIRHYVDDGRLHQLLWFLVISGGIAFLQWSLSPQIAYLWVPHDFGSLISDRAYFIVLFALSSIWAVVVGIGFLKCGWPALLMLVYAKWGLFSFYFWGLVFWACSHGDCI